MPHGPVRYAAAGPDSRAAFKQPPVPSSTPAVTLSIGSLAMEKAAFETTGASLHALWLAD